VQKFQRALLNPGTDCGRRDCLSKRWPRPTKAWYFGMAAMTRWCKSKARPRRRTIQGGGERRYMGPPRLRFPLGSARHRDAAGPMGPTFGTSVDWEHAAARDIHYEQVVIFVWPPEGPPRKAPSGIHAAYVRVQLRLRDCRNCNEAVPLAPAGTFGSLEPRGETRPAQVPEVPLSKLPSLPAGRRNAATRDERIDRPDPPRRPARGLIE